MKLYYARVGRTPDRCDRCQARIPQHALCSTAENGMLYCQKCALVLRDPDETAHQITHARLMGDRAEPEKPV